MSSEFHLSPTLARLRTILGVTLALLAFTFVTRAQQMAQTFVLQPGWNSIWLDVDPIDRSPNSVFLGLPLASVWTWSERVTATDFIQNPATTGWNRNQWLGWFPPESPEAPLGNLHSVIPARAYLVKVTGSLPVTLEVQGKAVPPPTAWVPNQYNLRGFPTDPDSEVTFREFFRHSAAHWDAQTGTMTPIYRLGEGGVWTKVPPEDVIRRGEAYWVFAEGASDYSAPITLAPRTGNEIHFPPLAVRTTLTLENHTADLRTVIFRSRTPTSPASHAVKIEPPLTLDQNQSRTPLHLHTELLLPGQTKKLSLYLDRTQSPAGRNEALFTCDDQRGTLQYLPLVSEGGGMTDTNNEVYPLAGLWLGTATLNAVAEAQGTNTMAPTPVQSPFNLRLIVFVDTNGAASLLREATLVTLPTTTTNLVSTNGGGFLVTNIVLVPGQPVLLSNPTLVGQYQSRYQYSAGVAARRFTAAQFDSSQPDGAPLTGSFATNGTLSGSLTLPFNQTTNPYYHKYHPDHDNLDPTGQVTVPEAYTIDRQVEFDFSPVGTGVPSYGVDGLDGIYREAVSGLHKVPLVTSGIFSLQRISTVSSLNPPLP